MASVFHDSDSLTHHLVLDTNPIKSLEDLNRSRVSGLGDDSQWFQAAAPRLPLPAQTAIQPWAPPFFSLEEVMRGQWQRGGTVDFLR